ncbi:hypothetical protein AGABI1DRAFT_114438 [Agaricus bisporus var. burnettii JB137-S8]|uniref:Uncharacterized protein n=1 Tax=Agaricus bisporus var. burnettii (strain JB137-S8 / ATCC MYA-4627 / FGSC 10392) TaxID=597362 RepID=K5X6N2_AGABU|nr:uncharacterized protein AGABI1DRAFT_114438 [Agaricus bisporus var. burnettii JB137-S8]EKM78873.1 hypothetical protein AGABI1DRAFT_114438 [Agaricus bisporus var. burnettii JB137-S8]
MATAWFVETRSVVHELQLEDWAQTMFYYHDHRPLDASQRSLRTLAGGLFAFGSRPQDLIPEKLPVAERSAISQSVELGVTYSQVADEGAGDKDCDTPFLVSTS